MFFLELSVNEGSSTTLECIVRGNPTPTVTWTKEGKVIGHGPRLVLVNLNQSSGGAYTCTADTGIPQLNPRSTAHIAHVSMEVLYSPRVTTTKHKAFNNNIFFKFSKNYKLFVVYSGFRLLLLYYKYDTNGSDPTF